MAKRTILITGGSGMLASEIYVRLSGKLRYNVIALPKRLLDVTQTHSIQTALDRYLPDYVINTAVFHVEDSETDSVTAHAINTTAARTLAEECQRRDIGLIQISTCGLFGDEVRAYHENDSVVLKTTYARTKFAGEEYVRKICERSFVLRLGWLYGGGIEHRRNFVIARYREAVSQTKIECASDKHGSPTYAGDVANTIDSLLDSAKYGTYHIANQGGCTRAEYVQAIVQGFGLDTAIKKVDSSHFPRKAPVPNCEILTSLNLEHAGLPLLPPWQESLSLYIRTVASLVQG